MEARIPYKIASTPCLIEKEFGDSGRFEIVKGLEYVVNGRIQFPPSPSEDGRYRFKFLGAEHDGVTYCRCDPCMSKAVTRLMSVRCPERPGFDQFLRVNQRTFLKNFSLSLPLFRNLYRKYFDDYLGFEREAEIHHADPHTKRMCRIQAWDALVAAGDQFTSSYMEFTTWSFKWETAKPGKYPRAYCNLGLASSLRGAWLTDKMKKAQSSEPIHFAGGTIEFVKTPDPEKLDEVMNNLVHPTQRYYASVFSDDSCLSIWHEGRLYRFNLDISGCDASHTETLFEAYAQTYPENLRDEIDELISQCEKPCYIFSFGVGRRFVKLIPRGPYLPSGSVLTTSINTFGVIIIIIHIVSTPFPPGPIQVAEIERRAQQVGYILTVEDCSDDMHSIQFLKHSPVYDTNGSIRALINLGVVVRMFGTAKNDIPGRGSLYDRCREFAHATLHGAVPYVDNVFYNTIKQNFSTVVRESIQRAVDETFKYKTYKLSGNPIIPLTVSNDELFARYSLDPHEQHVMETEYANLKVGEFLAHSALDKILKVDYGMATIHP